MGHQHSTIQDGRQICDLTHSHYGERLWRKTRRAKATHEDATPARHRDEFLPASIRSTQVETSITVTPRVPGNPKGCETPANTIIRTDEVTLAFTPGPPSTLRKSKVEHSLSESTAQLNTKTHPLFSSAVRNAHHEIDIENDMKRLSMALSKVEYGLEHGEEYAATSSRELQTKCPRPRSELCLGSQVKGPDTAQIQQISRKQDCLASNNPYRGVALQKEHRSGFGSTSSGATMPTRCQLPTPPMPKVKVKVKVNEGAETGREPNCSEEGKRASRKHCLSILTTALATLESHTTHLKHLASTAYFCPEDGIRTCQNETRPELRGTLPASQQEQPGKCKTASDPAAKLPGRLSNNGVFAYRRQVTGAAATMAGTPAKVKAEGEAEARRDQESNDCLLALRLQEEEERARAAVYVSQPPSRECTVCCEFLHPLSFPASLPSSQCTHRSQTCETCLQRWVATQMDAKCGGNICCPQCTQQLSYSDVQRTSDWKAFKRYDEFLTKEAIEALPDFSWCLRLGCSSGQENRPGSAYMKCASCKYQQCLRHKTQWHNGETCIQFDKRLRAIRDKSRRDHENLASERFIKQAFKACPGCKVPIEKSNGCDHMICKRCQQEFCYLCLVKYEDVRRFGSFAHAAQCRHREWSTCIH